MNDNMAISSDSRTIRRLDVETPLGVVHLAGFVQKPDHRSVILGILSEYVGEPVTAGISWNPKKIRVLNFRSWIST